LDYHTLQHLLEPRDQSAHKGDFGHVLVIAGGPGYGGSGMMAAQASARVGAGLTTLATHPQHVTAVLVRQPEIMARGVLSGADLAPLLCRATVLVLGPGLGQDQWAHDMLTAVMSVADELPMVIDADALHLLAKGTCNNQLPPAVQRKWILTPHPGEAALLLKSDTSSIQQNRDSAVRQLQSQWGGVAVLKGAGTLVCHASAGSHQAKVERCRHGNPGMASGGMGDVLSGVIAGLLAQGLTLADAARLGVCLHGMAADIAADDGQRGMLATDLLPWIRKLANPA
jgi:ADP-dependent NAD(P)H-hydrate dehydratase / NAD(P)H-hydrate epimerase